MPLHPVLFRILQRSRIDYEELAYTSMESGKSPTMCCMHISETRSVSRDLRSRETDTKKSQFEAGDEMRHLS